MPEETTRAPGPQGRSALKELARDDSSRKSFLKMMGGAGAVSAFSIFVAACGSDDEEQQPQPQQTQPREQGAGGDIDIVNYALTLEYLEADFYRKVEQAGLFKGRQLSLIKSIGQNEQEHVTTLEQTVQQLGGTPAKKPKTKFPLESRDEVLNLAATVENLGAAAYLGQVGKITDEKILAAALSIHTVEARHAAALNEITGQEVSPDGAFAKPATMDEVLPKVMPFIVS